MKRSLVHQNFQERAAQLLTLSVGQKWSFSLSCRYFFFAEHDQPITSHPFLALSFEAAHSHCTQAHFSHLFIAFHFNEYLFFVLHHHRFVWDRVQKSERDELG